MPVDTLVYVDGTWHEGNPPVMGPVTQSAWMGTSVFDGARAFRGTAPDLDLHCQRLIDSAYVMGLKPMLTATEVEDIAWEGISRFSPDTELYIRPMFYAEDGFVVLDPDSTRFTMSVLARALKKATGFSASLSRWRRPAPDMAPTEAKAGCLYPNVARAIREANAAGFDTAIMLDPNGNVAEFATANLFIVKDGVAQTPVLNRTFLNGVTRRRVMRLLRDDGVEVVERSIAFDDVLNADEVFSTGNLDKVLPATRIDDRDFQPGPVAERARALYFEWAKSQTRK
ncbi:MAG: branched-chain amino acid aminotransferase [Alphaproteobacteria bacterium]